MCNYKQWYPNLLKFHVHIPSMPSITNLPREKLFSYSCIQSFWREFGRDEDPNGDDNCRYYAIFEAFEFLGKDLDGKKLFIW